jgi:diguanylate cyclase (GGDEF)-like protein
MEVKKTGTVLPVDEGLGNEPTPKHPFGETPSGFVSKRPRRRSREGISDVAFIMGIPESELTPSVQEALTIIMKEFDRQRDEIEHAREYTSFLEEVADRHAFLPVMNRRALMRELALVLARAEHAETTSVFLYFHVRNAEEFRLVHGHGIAETALVRTVEVVRERLRASDAIGSMDGHDFGVILAATEMDGALDKARVLVTALDGQAFVLGKEKYRLDVACGFHLIEAGDTVEEVVDAADRDLRAGSTAE